MTTKQEFQHLKPYERPSNYCGATWYGYYDVAGRHRDSDVLANSNWDCWVAWLTELLGPEGVELEGDEDKECVDAWVICRESHWAVGWVEFIRVHESVDPEILLKIDEKLHDLDGYPVFNEEHWSNAEMEEYHNCWERYGAREDFIRAIRKAFTAARTDGEDYAEEDAILDALDDVPTERFVELHEQLIQSGEYHDAECWPNTDLSIREMEWDHVEALTKPINP